ncbi:hypothetical protein AYL99_05032 [Fonsecaea erecta]|uniref:peptidylprolyl isomerase n=1 Tax=Fonsecaea erecta TaxID=1367422 RepID=A0A178ZJQ8_9EURO|nr:hypothetical protein AYL99_05032 [Fonsecaea erecta]OAP60030.1 hypothetical protein AYL99_05032 [Fonsecaea erecta]
MASEFHKKLLSQGNGVDYPKKGDEVMIEYTGWLYDASKPDQDYKGNKFDSSVGRGAFKTQIGVGRVIQGWDHGVPQMSLGEKSRLTIPGIRSKPILYYMAELQACIDKDLQELALGITLSRLPCAD